MFPPANAQVYYNEAGEPLGWDIPNDDPPDPDEYDPWDREDSWIDMDDEEEE